MKRSFHSSGNQGYDEGLLPPKLYATSQWTDYSQDDYSIGGTGSHFSTYGNLDGALSFQDSSHQLGMGSQYGGRGGGKSRITDKLENIARSPLSGSFAGSSHSGYLSDFDTGRGAGNGYGYGYNHGRQSGDQYGFGQGYGYSQESDWSYGRGYDDYPWDSQQSSSQRGRGRGQGWGQTNRDQGRGQMQQRGYGKGGQSPGRGANNQAARGRGRGQGLEGGRGYGQGVFRGARGQGRGNSSGNYSAFEGNGYGKNQGGFSTARGGRGRGQGVASSQRGRGRGVGKAASASQVQSVSENIMGLVGGKGQQAGRGRGAARGRGGVGKTSALMDIVDTANVRKFGKTFNPAASEEANRLAQFLDFFRDCPDRVNGIQTITNAVAASRLNMQVHFEAEELMFVTKPLFTGELRMGSYFLTRGLGLSKKAVKHDCFQRAVDMLRNMSVEEIQALEDCGKEALKAEVQRQSEEDLEAFKTFLHKDQSESSTDKTDAPNQEANKKPGKKKVGSKQQKQAEEVESTVKIHKAALAESQVAERNFPLADKMMMLVKEVEKSGLEEQGVAMASRFDVLCFKVGISVAALFRAVSKSQARSFNTQPYKGDPDVELICEIYYDGVQVGQGQGRPRKEAQNAAYNNIHSRLMSEPISQIVQGDKLPSQPESLPDYFEVIYKGAKPQEGNNHQRLHSLRTYPPDLTQKAEDMVVIETVGDSIEDNAYKILEFSASKGSMLLEWKQLDKGNITSGFRCEMTLNGQKSAIGVGPAKPKARNAAAAMLLTEMYLSQDVISFQPQDDFENAIPISDLRERAEKLRSDGPHRPDRVECMWPESQKTSAPEGSEDMATATKNWISDPLRPWIEDAIVELMESHCKKVTLEELIIGPSISNTMRRFCYAAARHCLLIASMRNDSTKGSFITFHARGITPQEMVKILHLCKNKSGRYTLVRANKPFSAVQQAQFARTFPDVWPARARAAQEAERQKKELAKAEAMQAGETEKMELGEKE